MSWIALASLVGSLLTSGFSLWKQQKENKTTRDFNAEESEKNRQWQEDMYNKYESPTAQVLQRMQAGLNPYADVTSQSVGTGSTASAGSSSLPGLSDPFAQMPSMMMQLKSYRVEQQQKQATLDKTKEETRSITLDNQMKALEAGNRDEWIRLEMELMREDARGRKASADKLEAEASRAWDIAYQSRHFTEAGGNEFEDAHQKFVDEHNKVFAEIDKIKSDTDYQNALTKTENDLREGKVDAQTTANLAAAFEYKLRKKYGEDLAAIDYQQAKREFENDKELNQVYKTMVRNRSKILESQSSISNINAEDLETLPMWKRYLLSLFEKVVENAIDIVL